MNLAEDFRTTFVLALGIHPLVNMASVMSSVMVDTFVMLENCEEQKASIISSRTLDLAVFVTIRKDLLGKGN